MKLHRKSNSLCKKYFTTNLAARIKKHPRTLISSTIQRQVRVILPVDRIAGVKRIINKTDPTRDAAKLNETHASKQALHFDERSFLIFCTLGVS